MKLNAEIKAALDATGKPWEISHGGKHMKIRLGGKLVGVTHMGGKTDGFKGHKNLLAQIRRSAKEE